MSENIYSEKMTGGVEQLEEEKIHYRPTETKEKNVFGNETTLATRP